jgi:Peptidase MA superfamily/Tetratricopeptide repeat
LLEFAHVRRLFIGVLVLAATSATADTIHLKSGQTVVASNVHEDEGQIKYELNDNTYGIPKSLVERIDRDGSSPESGVGGAAAAAEPAARAPVQTTQEITEMGLRGADRVGFKVVHDGKVDQDALNAIDKTTDPAVVAAGYFIAGRFELDHGDRDHARRYFETALAAVPDNGYILQNYALTLLKLGRAREAVTYAERATRALPDSADSWAVLGYCYYSADRGKDAQKAFQRSLDLHPDENLQKLADKLKREMTTEANFSERETGHFTLRYEGATKDQLRAQIISALEGDYNDLSNELGITPSQNIPVILYTEEAYFDVTRAPGWTGALNDGKLRIPVQGVDGVSGEMARVLRHELTHSFVAQASGSRCPTWLNEGIAQLMEPRDSSVHGQQLALLYSQHIQIPLQALEGSFMRFHTNEAVVAYAESLAAAEYIRETYGMSELRRILERLGQGASMESAMKEFLHSDYSQFNDELGRYLISKYGG